MSLSIAAVFLLLKAAPAPAESRTQLVELGVSTGEVASNSPLDGTTPAVSLSFEGDVTYARRLASLPWLWVGGTGWLSRTTDVTYPAQVYTPSGGAVQSGSSYESLTASGIGAQAVARFENRSHFTPDVRALVGLEVAWHGPEIFFDNLSLAGTGLPSSAELALVLGAGAGVSFDLCAFSVRVGFTARRDLGSHLAWRLELPLTVGWRW